MASKDDKSPATKADIRGLQASLKVHDDQFELILKVLGSVQEDTQALRKNLRLVADKLLDDHERRLGACERRLGLVV